MDISGEDNKIFHIHFHSDCLLRCCDLTALSGVAIECSRKVIIHSQKVFTGNSQGGGEGGFAGSYL